LMPLFVLHDSPAKAKLTTGGPRRSVEIIVWELPHHREQACC